MTSITRLAWVAAAVATFFFVFSLLEEEEPPAAPPAEPDMFSFVSSLQHTQPDGRLEVKGEALVVSAELVRMFDYYLSAVGEKSLEAIRAEIERDIDARLKGLAAGQAKDLLTRYLAYKRELVEVERQPQTAGSGADAIRHRIAAMQKVRARHFTPHEIEAMFALDDAYDLDALARFEVSEDRSLSDQQKRDKLAALDASLHPALREAREEPLKVFRLEESVASMRASGASEDEIYRKRATAFTPEAAARLAELDREDEHWRTRIAAYKAQRDQLLLNSGHLPEADRQAYIEQLQQAHFTPDEQKRLAAYE